MIKALLLIFRPVQTWGAIEAANRSIAYVLWLHLLPLILLTSIAEGYGLVEWGRVHQGEMSYTKKYDVKEVIVVEIVQSLIFVGLAFLGAYAAQTYAATFHRRTMFRQAFTAIAYGMAPLLTLRLGDLIGGLNAWVPWAIGIVLTIGVLYMGLPCLLKPDPPHAFGLYVMTSLTLVVMFGLWRLITWQYFLGRFPAAEQFVGKLVGLTVTGDTPP